MSPPAKKTRLIVPLIGPTVAAMRGQMAAATAAGADTVECRLDYLESPPAEADLEALLSDAPVDVIVTCRSRDEGGRFPGDESRRLRILHDADEFAPAFVDVEMEAGIVPDEQGILSPVILSHHDFQGCPENLEVIVSKLESSTARVNKVAFQASGPEDALRAFDAIRACRKPTLALAMGEAGVLSRVLAPKFGAFGTFAALETGAESAPGQPTLAELKTLYRWDALNPKTKTFGVIGCPIAHSMSPAVHNAAFAAAGIDAVYVPLRIEPGDGPFRRFLDALLDRPWMDWRGLSVTIPHKENALAYVGAERCDELSRRIGAINTITLDGERRLRGHNTDYAAAIASLCAAMGIGRDGLSGRPVAVLGAGGASRAIVAALAHYGARVTVCNRTLARAEALAAEFDCGGACRAAPLTDDACAGAEILINCTPIGMHPRTDAAPLGKFPPSAKVVFDTIYNPVETLLLARARQAGLVTVSGLEMFVNQAAAQFELWTARPAPRDAMRKALKERLPSRETE
ncbi:MAG TPA: shikimate dehydrogenase [Phycisphaerae bacterium]|nr:shikimate dehydrogenase [Phycisphaerae bacterium]